MKDEFAAIVARRLAGEPGWPPRTEVALCSTASLRHLVCGSWISSRAVGIRASTGGARPDDGASRLRRATRRVQLVGGCDEPYTPARSFSGGSMASLGAAEHPAT